MVAFTWLRGFLSGVWSVTLLNEHLIVVFLFLEGAWSNTLDFCFRWLLRPCPKWTTWGPGTYVAPPFHWGSQSLSLGVLLVFRGLHSVGFTCFGFFVVGSAPPSLGVLGHAFLVCPWTYLVLSLSSLWALPGALTRLSPSRVDHLLRESSVAS